MDVVTPEQAKIAEDAGAVAVMALERVPADIRAAGRRRPDERPRHDRRASSTRSPSRSWPRPASATSSRRRCCRRSASTTSTSPRCSPRPTRPTTSTSGAFTVPFVCGATNLGEALRRIAEGAAMIRSKGEAGTGNVVEATRHMRSIRAEHQAAGARSTRPSCTSRPRSCGRRTSWSREVAELGKLPVVLFTAGGIATPADAAMMMQLGAEGVFVGSGIFKSGDPAQRAAAIVKATTFYDDPDVIAKVSRGLGEAMVGINVDDAPREPSATPTAAGERDPASSGSSPCRATSASTWRALRGAGRRARCRSAVRRSSTGVDGLVIPGGESTTIVKLAARVRAARAAARARSRDGLPVYGSCAGMILLADRILDGTAGPGDRRRPRHHRAAQRLRPAGRLVRGRPRRSTGSTAAACTRSSSARPWVEEAGDGRRGARPGRRRSGRR